MNRDGALISIWQEGITDYQPVNNWNEDDIYDVLVVGGGITGLTTALLLQEEGKKCVLAEAHNIGYGTTGGTTAHLNTILDTPYNVIEKKFSEDDARLVAAGTKEAIDLVDTLVKRYHIDCDFRHRSAYLLANGDKEEKELEEIILATVKTGIVGEQKMGAELTLPLPCTQAGLFDGQASMHSTQYLKGLAKAYESLGGVLLQHCFVGDIHSDGQFTANCTYGKIKALHVVYATHIPPGISILHFRCAPYRSYAMAFTLKSGLYPQELIYDMKDPYHYIRSQSLNGREYIIAGGFDHKTGHNENTEQTFRQMEAFYREHFDIDDITFRWSSQYFEPADGLPYIGLLPGHSKTYVATGFSGNGMTLGTLAGRIIAGLIVKNESPFKELFNPSRVKPVAGFENFVKENADVVSKFIGMRLSHEKITSLVELAPGEATLAEWQNKDIALYKDINGKIYALDPVCPHAGCLVAWNNAERSWDCPCHGSRFACNGAVLTGPAQNTLRQISWEDIGGD